MTRKKYIKILMSLGVQRNEENLLADHWRQTKGGYTDIREYLMPSLILFGMRCGIQMEKVYRFIRDCSKNIDKIVDILSAQAGDDGDAEYDLR